MLATRTGIVSERWRTKVCMSWRSHEAKRSGVQHVLYDEGKQLSIFLLYSDTRTSAPPYTHPQPHDLSPHMQVMKAATIFSQAHSWS